MDKTLIESYRQQAMNMFNIARTKNPLYNSVSEPVLKNMPEDIMIRIDFKNRRRKKNEKILVSSAGRADAF